MKNIMMRPVVPNDTEFLVSLYRTTREEELAAVINMQEEDKHAFISMQFQLQSNFYRSSYPDAEFQMILMGEEAIGRYYLDRKPDVFHIIDLLLLPAMRGQGIGGAILDELLAEGRKVGLPVTIYLQKTENSWSLFERLGFEVVAENGVNFLLEWKPSLE